MSDIRKICEQTGCDIEVQRGSKSVFYKVFFDPVSIWMDTDSLPPEAYYCAAHDGAPLLEAEVGPDDNLQTKQFLNMDWLINSWGAEQEIIDVLVFEKFNIMEDVPRLVEKYCS